jgi:hypothetical protein
MNHFTMPLTEYLTRQCLAVMDRLLSYRISSMFSQPVDPTRDGCPTYPDIVAHPMDLGTVRTKLQHNEYDTLSQWRHDVSLVWDNAVAFNGPNSLIAMLARQLQGFFKEWTENLTADEKGSWVQQLNDLRTNIANLRGQSPKALQGQKPAKIPGRPHKPDAKRIPHIPHKRVVEGQSPKRKAPLRSQSLQLAARLSQHEMNQLTDSVTSLLENETVMGQIVALIRRHEPELIDADEVEIDIGRLRADTLFALKRLVDGVHDFL